MDPAKHDKRMPTNRRRATPRMHSAVTPRSRGQKIRRILLWCGVGGLALAALGAATIAITFWVFGRDPNLPDIRSLEDYHPKQVSRVLSGDGKVVDYIYTEQGLRSFVGYDQVPEKLVQAFIAAEDAGFWKHGGIDYWGMVRAFFTNVKAGRSKQGASTITQQVVKTFFLSPKKTFKRKIQEIILARRLERALSKEEILTLYLNQIYLGEGRYGIQEATRFYFGKDVKDLTVGEAALLAGLPQSPNNYAPSKRKNAEAAKRRQSYVLEQMARRGYITEAEAKKWIDEPIRVVARPYPEMGTAPEWQDVARSELIGRYGEDKLFTLGANVKTTLDRKVQAAARLALQAALRGVDKRQKHGIPVRKLKGDKIDLEIAKLARKLPKDGPKPDEIYDAVVREVHDGAAPAAGAAAPAGAAAATATAGELVVDLGNWKAAVVLGGPGDARYNQDGKKPSERFAVGDVVRVMRPPAKAAAAAAAAAAASGAPDDEEAPQPAAEEVAAAVAAATPKAKHAEREVVLSPGPEGAVVVMDPATRRVLAVVGGYDSEARGFNRATRAHRQPGSTFKPIVYAAAIESGSFTPATLVNDAPEVYNLWKPENYKKGNFEGPVRLRYALARSINTVAIRVCNDITPARVAALAHALGINSELPEQLSLALGSGEVTPLELTNAFATLVDGGKQLPPRFIDDVDGKPLPKAAPVQALSAAAAYVVTDMMRSVVDEGTAAKAKELGIPVAGKTGTSNDARDAWFMGTTGDLVVGIWIGFDDNRSLGKLETGGVAALPAFIDLMKAIGARGRVIPRPVGVAEAQIDKATGLLSPAGAPAGSFYTEVFLEGKVPTEIAPRPGEVDATTFVVDEYGDDRIEGEAAPAATP
jgi:penicillin-binding protein 1A